MPAHPRHLAPVARAEIPAAAAPRRARARPAVPDRARQPRVVRPCGPAAGRPRGDGRGDVLRAAPRRTRFPPRTVAQAAAPDARDVDARGGRAARVDARRAPAARRRHARGRLRLLRLPRDFRRAPRDRRRHVRAASPGRRRVRGRRVRPLLPARPAARGPRRVLGRHRAPRGAGDGRAVGVQTRRGGAARAAGGGAARAARGALVSTAPDAGEPAAGARRAAPRRRVRPAPRRRRRARRRRQGRRNGRRG
mmetsp:Transcript_18572/g.54943  ORF Transcript_18572/g.54943 Transcript_18572/m.54943 type:complete len:251 (-) Transcript_18572:47-799(-)